MTEQVDDTDLSEMHGHAIMAAESGFATIQLGATVAVAVLAELRELRAKARGGGWHPDSEPPPNGRIVLVAGDGFMAVAFRIGDEWFDGARTDTGDGEHPLNQDLVTHWHELPDDPPSPPEEL